MADVEEDDDVVEKKEKKSSAKKGDATKKDNPFKQLVEFLGDVKRELKKVAWPSRSDTLASTWVVITLAVIFSLFLFFADTILKLLLRIALT